MKSQTPQLKQASLAAILGKLAYRGARGLGGVARDVGGAAMRTPGNMRTGMNVGARLGGPIGAAVTAPLGAAAGLAATPFAALIRRTGVAPGLTSRLGRTAAEWGSHASPAARGIGMGATVGVPAALGAMAARDGIDERTRKLIAQNRSVRPWDRG